MNGISAPVYDAQQVGGLLNLKRGVFIERPPLHLSPALAEGFATFFDPGWSILRLRSELADEAKGVIFCRQSWYDRQDFAHTEDRPTYRRLRMEAIPGTFSNSFSGQKAHVPYEEKVPPIRVAVMGIILHFLACGERLFRPYWVRCLDRDSGENNVAVGRFDADGLRISAAWGDDRYDDLGLVTTRDS